MSSLPDHGPTSHRPLRWGRCVLSRDISPPADRIIAIDAIFVGGAGVAGTRQSDAGEPDHPEDQQDFFGPLPLKRN